MSVRVDWNRIKEIAGSSIGEPVLFILPSGGRELLMSTIDRLKWEATFRVAGYDYSDWDDLQAMVAMTDDGLMRGEKMSEIVDALMLIYNALLESSQANYTMQCCGDLPSETADPGVEIGEGVAPAEYGTQPVTDWQHYQNYICAAAKKWVESMQIAIGQLKAATETNMLVIGGIAALLALLASPAVGILIAINYGLAAALFSELIEAGAATLLDELETYFIENEQSLANEIYCASTPEQAAANIRAKLELDLTAGQWAIVRWFNIENSMNIVFAGQDADGNTVNVEPDTTCTCGYDWQIDVEGFETGIGEFGGDAPRVAYADQNAPSPDGSLYGRFFNPRSNDMSDRVNVTREVVDSKAGVENTDTVRIERIEFDLYVGADYADKLLHLKVFSGYTEIWSQDLVVAGTPGQWEHMVFSPNVDCVGGQGQYNVIEWVGAQNSNPDVQPPPLHQCLIDNCFVGGRVVV